MPDVDARSDVFSFGVVLYEMLAGRVPFEGETATNVLAAIINSEPPPLQNFATHLPRELQRIVHKTLRKNRSSAMRKSKKYAGRHLKRTSTALIFAVFLYTVAFIEGDAPTMTKHLAWFGGRADEYLALNVQANSAAFQGHWRATQNFARHAVDLANRSEANEVAAQYAAEQALRIAFWNSEMGLLSGDDAQLKQF